MKLKNYGVMKSEKLILLLDVYLANFIVKLMLSPVQQI